MLYSHITTGGVVGVFGADVITHEKEQSKHFISAGLSRESPNNRLVSLVCDHVVGEILCSCIRLPDENCSFGQKSSNSHQDAGYTDTPFKPNTTTMITMFMFIP